MDLSSQFVFFLLFAAVGFVTQKLMGLNVYRLFSDISSAILIISMYSILFPAMVNPESASTEELVFRINEFVENFVNALPAMVLGDLAGSIIAAITGEQQ